MINEQSIQRNFWIFQARPEVFDLDRNLIPGNTDQWRIRNHFREIKPNDIVFFWQSGEMRGIYGWGIITDEPRRAEAQTKEKEDKPQFLAPFLYMVRFKVPILLKELLDNPDLEKMTILRSPQGASFRVTEKEAEAIQKIMKDRGEEIINEVLDNGGPKSQTSSSSTKPKPEQKTSH